MTEEFSYTVTGSRAFPLDMLRRDACWPATEKDTHKIYESLNMAIIKPEQRQQVKIEPKSLTWEIAIEGINPPTVGRWENYGYKVGTVVTLVDGKVAAHST